MNETKIVALFELYSEYAQQLNAAIRTQQIRLSEVKIMSQDRFLAAWNALSEPIREKWRSKLEAGYEEAAETARHKLVESFAPCTTRIRNADSSRAA